ncbi:MAG: hypothetical protein QXL96_10905 [Ignisphaera sp.]
MRITPSTVIAILLTDAILWGIWFGGLWSYRSAFASRLTDSYLHISMSTAMPLALSSITYLSAMYKPTFFRVNRVKLFKLSILLSRVIYFLSSIAVYLNIFSGLELLYIFSVGISIAYSIGTIAGIAWTDYVADNVPDTWKPRYIALDSTLSTVGALIGTAIAGTLFVKDSHILTYGKLFLIISAIFLIDTPMIMLIKEFKDTKKDVLKPAKYSFLKRSSIFYVSIVLLYTAINLPYPLIAPYIIRRIGGNEIWITMMNGASLIASLATPLIWGEILRKLPSLTLARVAIVIAIASSATLPYLKSLELQIIRAFIAGAGGIGIWISIFGHIIRDTNPEHRIQHSSTIYMIQSFIPAIAMNVGGALADIIHAPEIIFLLSLIGLAALPMIKNAQEQEKHNTTISKKIKNS